MATRGFSFKKKGVRMEIVTERELDIIRSRYNGETFREIGERHGLNYTRIQQIYGNALRKLRVEKDLRNKNPELLRACKRLNWDFRQLHRLYSILKRNNALCRWKRMSEEELLNLEQLGPKYVEFLIYARENCH